MTLDKKNKIVSILFASIYIILFPIAIFYNISNNNTIRWYMYILYAILSAFIILIFPYLKNKFNIEVLPLVRIIILSFILIAVYCGDMFDFYHLIPSWDLILHFIFGFISTFIAYLVIKNIFLKELDNTKGVILSVIIAIMFSLSVALLWEVFEYTTDSLLGGNAQRVIPEIFNNGNNTKLPLEGNMEDIYNFYLQPQGYRYALEDTMTDIIVCLGGTVLSSAMVLIIAKTASVNEMNYLIYKEDKILVENN